MAQGTQNAVGLAQGEALQPRTGTPWRAHTWLAHLADYWTLTKPEVNFLVLVSALVGFCLASPGALNGWLLFHTLMGTLLVASGTGTLNQYLERRTDAFMRRTANRPLPAGRLKHQEALWFGILLSIVGGTELWVAANPLTSALALGTLGHLPAFLHAAQAENAILHLGGSLPGSSTAADRLGRRSQWPKRRGLGALRHPFLMAVSSPAGDCLDVSRGLRPRGFADAAPQRPRRPAMARQIIGCTLALLPVSLIPALTGHAGNAYLVGAGILGAGFLYYGARMAAKRTNVLAKQLLMASIVYLPLVLGLLMFDRI